MNKVTHCRNHTKYTPGCPDCLTQSRLYRKEQKERNDDTHYKNGQPKRQGVYSEANWERFNALGRALTNQKDE